MSKVFINLLTDSVMMCQIGIRVQQQYYLESLGSRGWPSKETVLLF